MIFLLELIIGTMLAGAMVYAFGKVNKENITTFEKLCRNKAAGVLIGLPAALLCVPLALPVSPVFLIPWLYPLAIVVPLLCYWHIDSYAARSYSFFLILLAYDIIHGAFNHRLPGAAVITVIALLMGVFGIWCSAKPSSLRDIFRKCANSNRWKYAVISSFIIMTLLPLYTLIMLIIGVYTK